jgi:hypothetical protein
MPTCYICNLQVQSCKGLIKHYKSLHLLTETSIFKCTENACCRVFSTLNSFRKHMKSHNVSQDNISLKLTEPFPSTSSCDVKFNADFENDNVLKGSRNVDFKKEFMSLIHDESLKFVSKLYAATTLNRKQVQSLIEDVTNFISIPLTYLNDVFNKLVENLDDKNFKDQINVLFAIFKNVFNNLKTEYHRFKTLTAEGTLIEPEEILVGQRLEQNQLKKLVYKKSKIQYVPMKSVLKLFFELPGVFHDTSEYMSNLNLQNNVVSNIVQSNFWRNKLRNFESKLVIPMYIYFDEYETGNPLGAHAGMQKLGAVYYSIPCIPPLYQGKLDYIFLALLFYSIDLQHYGNSVIFSKLLNELILLENEGIEINIDGTTSKMYFSVALIIGDNLGLHTLLGFTESFRSNYSCRFCKCIRTFTQTQSIECTELLRNENSYASDLEVNNISLTGIKSACIWNRIPSFHVTENYAVDIMHDIFEGVANYDMILILRQFILIDKFFTLATLKILQIEIF